MIDCPHCGRSLDIVIRAGSCPHCQGNLAANSVGDDDPKSKKKEKAIPTGTLDLSSFMAVQEHEQSLAAADAQSSDSDVAASSGGGNGSAESSDAPVNDPDAAPTGGASPFATMVPVPEVAPSAIPTVEGAKPHSSTVGPDSAAGVTPANPTSTEQAQPQAAHPSDPPNAPVAPGSKTLTGGQTAFVDPSGPMGSGPFAPANGGTQSADQTMAAPGGVPQADQTMAAPGGPPMADQTMAAPGGPPMADQTMKAPGGPQNGGQPPSMPQAPMFENAIPTVQAGSPSGSDATFRPEQGGQKPAGRSSAGVKQMWEGFADSRVGPMASIKSDDMSVGRDDGLVIHRRQLAPADAPKAQESDYMVVSYLGQGAMGVVFEANQTSMQRDVAIKTLRPELARKASDRQKFLYEASITGDLDHPNIVPIHDVGVSHDGTLFYSMKRVEGTPWQNVMHTKNRAENLEILMKVADAISFAHSRDVIHRDLKPENVMLGQFGEVLVMDWGLAVNLTKTKEFVLGGTPAYMAPEMARHQLELIGKTSDIYLLGAILFHLISGLPPHPGETVTQCVAAAARNQLIPVQNKDELLSIALKAMEHDPANRYPTVGDFQQAIRDYQDHAESIQLAKRADEDLASAIANQDYQAYSRARFGFQDAVKLWPANESASEGYQRATIAHATEALNKQDFDLGISMLDEKNPEEEPLLVQLRRGKRERENRVRRFRLARRAAFLLLVGLVILAGGAAAWINKEKNYAQQESIRADKEKDRAVEAEKDAIEQKELAEKETERAVNAEADALTQKELAEQETERAERETIRAVSAEQDALAQRNIAEQETERAEVATIDALKNGVASEQERLKAYDSTIDVTQSTYAIKLAKLRSDFNLIRNDIADGNVDQALDSVRQIFFNTFPRPDENYPISFKGWELYRLMHLARAGRPSFEFAVDNPAKAIDMRADGSLLAIGDMRGFIHLYDVANNAIIKTQRVKEDGMPRIEVVRFGPNDSELFVGTREHETNNLFVFDSETLEATSPPMMAHGNGVRGIQVSDDGLTLITCGIETRTPFGSYRRWTRERAGQSFEEVQESVRNFNFRHTIDVDRSGDGQRSLVVIKYRIGQDDNGVEIEGQRLAVLLNDVADQLPMLIDYDAGDVTCAKFDPSDSSGNRIFVGTSDGSVLRWQLEEIQEPNNPNDEPVVVSMTTEVFLGHDPASSIRHLDVQMVKNNSTNAEELRLITAADIEVDDEIRNPELIIWDIDQKLPRKRLYGHEQQIRNCGQTSDGQYVYSVSSDRLVRVWSVASVIDELSIQGDVRPGTNQLPDINSLDFSDNEKWVAGGDRFGRLSMWDRTSGRSLASVRMGHELNQTMMSFDVRELNLFASASSDGTVRIWNPIERMLVREWNDAGNLRVFSASNNRKWIVMELGDGRPRGVRVVNLETMDESVIELLDISPLFADPDFALRGAAISDDGSVVYLNTRQKVFGYNVSDSASLGGFSADLTNVIGLTFAPGDTKLLVQYPQSVALYAANEQLSDPDETDLEFAERAKISLDQAQFPSDELDQTLIDMRFRRSGDRLEAMLIYRVASRDAGADASDDPLIGHWIGVVDATNWADLPSKNDGYDHEMLNPLAKLPGSFLSADFSEEEGTALALLGTGEVHQVELASGVATKDEEMSDAAQGLVARIESGFGGAQPRLSAIDVSEERIIVSGQGFAEIWDTELEQGMFQISPWLPMRSVRFLPGSESLVATHGDGHVMFWGIEDVDGELRFTMQSTIPGAATKAEIGPSADEIIIIHSDGTASIHSVESGDSVVNVPSPDDARITAIDWVAGDDEESFVLVGTETGKAALYRLESHTFEQVEMEFPTHEAELTAVALTESQNYIATGDANGRSFLTPNPNRWAFQEGPFMMSGQGERIASLEFHNDEYRVLVTQGERASLYHLDNEKQNLVESVFDLNHDHRVITSRISPDGKLIATAPADEGRLIVWLTQGWEQPPAGDDIQVEREIERVERDKIVDAIENAQEEVVTAEAAKAKREEERKAREAEEEAAAAAAEEANGTDVNSEDDDKED